MEIEKVKALIIVDVQNDFCEGGSLAVPQASEIIPVINRLKSEVQFDYVIFTRDWHPPTHASFSINNPGTKVFDLVKLLDTGVEQVMWPAHCIQDTFGSEIHKDLEVKPTDVIINKGKLERVDSYSGFGTHPEDTGLEKFLIENNVNEVYCVGLAFDYCVGSTAYDSAIKGFKTYVIKEATKGIDSKSEMEMTKKLQSVDVELISISNLLK